MTLFFIEACHSSGKLHKLLHPINTPKATTSAMFMSIQTMTAIQSHGAKLVNAFCLQFHLLAITMVLAGRHLTNLIQCKK